MSEDDHSLSKKQRSLSHQKGAFIQNQNKKDHTISRRQNGFSVTQRSAVSFEKHRLIHSRLDGLEIDLKETSVQNYGSVRDVVLITNL